MSSLRKVAIVLVAAVVVWAVVVPNCMTEQVRVEQCSSCYAGRRTTETGLWVGGTRVFRGSTTVEADDSFVMDLGPVLGRGHAHQWAFSACHSYFLGFKLSLAHGPNSFNPVALAIRSGPDVRQRIEERIRAGEFTQEEVASILALPRSPTKTDAADPARMHLYRRGQDLLRAVGCAEARSWPGVAEKQHPPECPCQPPDAGK